MKISARRNTFENKISKRNLISVFCDISAKKENETKKKPSLFKVLVNTWIQKKKYLFFSIYLLWWTFMSMHLHSMRAKHYAIIIFKLFFLTFSFKTFSKRVWIKGRKNNVQLHLKQIHQTSTSKLGLLPIFHLHLFYLWDKYIYSE